ncbi:unnamed protein product, partial [Mesorhabditis belari]|uniref:Ubiquitin carboxyl-terminal hydrolase n=1 Tax=Mesorhabditis belari TaxID=2138241 RepID=A0AAF3F4S8_9BILA
MTEWLPLESNPDSINSFLEKIGVESVDCVDVFSFDDDMLEFVPKPQLAMLLCFPDYKKVDAIMRPIYEKLKADGAKVPEGVFFMEQKIRNACGTFALFHALGNIEGKVDLGQGSFSSFLQKAKGLPPSEISKLLEHTSDIASAHENAARSGETEAPPGDKVEHHFICFVNVNGLLYEIDSRASFPRPLGATSGDTLVKDAGVFVKQLMSQMENISFAAMALVPKQ